jgi:kynurenine formamidase
MQQIAFQQVVHLSHVITANIPQWPGDPPVEFETVASRESDGYYLRRFSLGEHSATHMNAPVSFHTTGIGIDRYPAQSLVIPAVVIDIRDRVVSDPDYAIALADVLNWEQKYGQIAPGSVVLLFTGWQDNWQDEQAFLNPDAEGKLHFPSFGLEATQFLLAQRQIAGIGIDTHGVDSSLDETFAINRLVLAEPRIILENLTNLNQLPPTGTTLVVGILRLQDGSGSPVAVLALVP